MSNIVSCTLFVNCIIVTNVVYVLFDDCIVVIDYMCVVG